MIRVRLEGNGSKRYDGHDQEIAAKHVLPEDLTGQVGATIRISGGGEDMVCGGGWLAGRGRLCGSPCF